MVKPITLYSGSAGINNRLDPQRLLNGTLKDAPGIIELAQASNVSIDDRFLVETRPGNTRSTAGSYHSLFCKGGHCFVIEERESDAAIMRVNGDGTTTGVRSNLTKNLRMAWDQSGGDTFYSNGAQNGYIRNGVSSAWPIGSYQGPTADMQFAASMPLASHIAFMQGGQVLLAVGSAVFSNHAPFQYGLFSLRSGNVAAFESIVTMLAAVENGFFASDGKATWFFRKTAEWYLFKQEAVEAAPAITGTLAHDKVLLRDIGVDANGFGRVWASTDGVCIGTDDGAVLQRTKEKFVYPAGKTSGACLITDQEIIHT